MASERIAVIGGGIAGLGASLMLGQRYPVTLFEKETQLGGHSHTREVDTPDQGRLPVDTGFMVFNHHNYPLLTRLFEWLDVATQATDMSFSASIDAGALEYSSDGLGGLFGQRRNLLRPEVYRIATEVIRFNRIAQGVLADPVIDEDTSLAAFLDEYGFSRLFREAYLLPMAAAIWSTPTSAMGRFPALSFLRFFANHHLLQLSGRPPWQTVLGGSRSYVERLAHRLPATIELGAQLARVQRRPDGVHLIDAEGHRSRFDHVVFACHPDQALDLIDAPSHWERSLLGAIRYQPNRALLHRDPRLMPRHHRVWASWNYFAERQTAGDTAVSVTYWMNRLQSLPTRTPVLVSLNPLTEPDPSLVDAELSYSHPVYDRTALRAQRALRQIQGVDRLWFCGSYHGYGFHEDGLRAAVALGRRFGIEPPWQIGAPASPAIPHLAPREAA
jgi:predicted NAD/FAD-binding protein